MINRAYLRPQEMPPPGKEYVLVRRAGDGFVVDHRIGRLGTWEGLFETREGAFAAAEDSASMRGLDLIYAKNLFDA